MTTVLDAIRAHIEEQAGIMLKRRGGSDEQQYVGIPKADADLLLAGMEAAVAHRLAELAEEAVDWDLDTPAEKEDEAHAAFVGALGALVDTKQRLDAAIAPLMEVTE